MPIEWAASDAEENNCTVITETISNSGHHMYVDNPKELADKMIDTLRRLKQEKLINSLSISSFRSQLHIVNQCIKLT